MDMFYRVYADLQEGGAQDAARMVAAYMSANVTATGGVTSEEDGYCKRVWVFRGNP